MIRRHWPIFFAALMVIISIVVATAASNSTDTGYAIFAGLIIFMLLLPLSGAVVGGWYGWRSRSPLKWLLAPAAFLGVCLLLLAADLVFGSGPIETDTIATIASITGAACLAAEVIAAAIARLTGRSGADRETGIDN